MKKIFSILIGLCFVVAIGAQTQSPRSFSEPTYTYFWGSSTVDTLTAQGVHTQVVRLGGNGLAKIDLDLVCTKTSGTVTNNMFISKSMDGTTFVNTDTIALSGASSGHSYKTISNWNYPYIRFQQIAPNTAQLASYKLWFIYRYQ